MNNINVKPGSAEAYPDNNSYLCVRERRESKEKVVPSISTLAVTKRQENSSEAVNQTPWWRLTATAIETLFFSGGILPDILSNIFPRLDFRVLQRAACVSRGWNRVAYDLSDLMRKEVEGIVFGKGRWKDLGLDIGYEPQIPPSLVKSLSEPDPVDSTQTIGNSHTLVLVPKGLTLESLGALVKDRFPGCQASGYRYIWDEILNQLTTPNEKSYWVLMKKDLIPGSRDQSFEKQKEMVVTFASNAKAAYVIPTTLEAAVCNLMHEVRTKERLFSVDPRTYTRCQEKISHHQVVVGGFASAGLSVIIGEFDDVIFGVAVLRKS